MTEVIMSDDEDTNEGDDPFENRGSPRRSFKTSASISERFLPPPKPILVQKLSPKLILDTVTRAPLMMIMTISHMRKDMNTKPNHYILK